MFAGKTSELLQHLTKHEVRREAAARHAPLTLPQEAGRRILVAKSDRDRRYAASEVVSHNGLRRVRSGAGCATPARALSRRRTACPRRAQPVFAVWTGGVREGGRGRCGRGTQPPPRARDVLPLTCCAGSVLSGPQGVLHPGCGQRPQAGAGGWAGRRLSEGAFRRGAEWLCSAMRAGLISIRQVLFLVPHADVVTKKSGLCKGCSQPSLFSLRTVADSRTELVGGGEAYQPTCRLCYARGLVHVHTAAAAP